MAMTEKQRAQLRQEQDATDFGQDRKKFKARLTSTEKSVVYKGYRTPTANDDGNPGVRKVVRKQVFDKERFQDARSEFENRGVGSGSAETQNRGASGGSFSTSSDFGPGAIRLNSVTPVNSKVGGR